MSTAGVYDQATLPFDPPTPNVLIERAIRALQSMKGWHAGLTVGSYFLTVAILDWLLGDEMMLLMLYFPVVAFFSVRVSLKVAINVAVACSVTWLVDDFLVTAIHGPSVGEILLATTHFFSFVVFGTVVSRLKIALHREHQRASFDDLTGLANMQTFYANSRRRLNSSNFEKQPFSIVFLDCDNFKTVNDTMGHAEGNRVLEAVAQELKAQTRETDCTARFGGDEFAVFLPGIAPADCQETIERLREKLNQRMEHNGWPVTFSIGIAHFAHWDGDIEDAVKIADETMYECKRDSKDAIFVKNAA